MLAGSPVVLAALAVAAVIALHRASSSASSHTHPVVTLSARTIRASLQHAGSRNELIVSGVPEPPIGEVYEIWLNRPSARPQPTDALFTVTSEGDAVVEVPGELRGVSQVTVTSEPLGGSSSPTSAPVLRLPVAQRR
jgi:hypothetical protein